MYSGILILVIVYELVSMSSTTAAAHAHAHVCPKDLKCGKFGNLSFPFSNYSQSYCDLFIRVNCSDSTSPDIFLGKESEYKYKLIQLEGKNNTIRVSDTQLERFLNRQMCESFLHTFEDSLAISFKVESNITLIKCFNYTSDRTRERESFKNLSQYNNCHDFTIYYTNPRADDDKDKPSYNYSAPLPQNCNLFTLPMTPLDLITNQTKLFQLLTAEYNVVWNLSDQCSRCSKDVQGSQCSIYDQGNCDYAVKGKKSSLGVIIGTVTGVLFVLVSLFAFFVWYRKKVRKGGLYKQSKGLAELTTSKSDMEDGSVYFGLHVFTYTELQEITNNFNDSNELGNGAFGTVYYGKLKDGREVAVKYLYEHNFKRMQQFKTEVEILTSLRHQNLVTLYGCTSRRSRDLLLVYEYISNGTVADHLHGSRAKDGSLPWSVRMNIAIESADALSYLHASDIIHRDVKSNNILLDNNFSVKVADFGLSRLFPHDVTHISTAPQGTPGYVDPEYHHYYQLTDKSDVYSFGVVLIELISSMPAVDMNRNSQDINLSSFAIRSIQKNVFDELIDPSLHIESDPEVRRMTTSVAELAFRCLQSEKEMRPDMKEVAVMLREIQMYKDNTTGTITIQTNQNDAIQSRTAVVPPSPDSEDVVLLRKKLNLPSSPISVTDMWNSLSSTSTSR